MWISVSFCPPYGAPSSLSRSFVSSLLSPLGVFARAQLKLHHRQPLIPSGFFFPESQAADSHLSFLSTSLHSPFPRSWGHLCPSPIFPIPEYHKCSFSVSKICCQMYLTNWGVLWGLTWFQSHFLYSLKKNLVSKVISLSLMWKGCRHYTNGVLAIDLFSFLWGFLWKTRSGFIFSKLMIPSACTHVHLSVCLWAQPPQAQGKLSLPGLDTSIHLKSFMLRKWFKVFGNWKMATYEYDLQWSYFLHMKPFGSFVVSILELYWMIHCFLCCLMLPCLCLCYSLFPKYHFSFIHSFDQKYLLPTYPREGATLSGWDSQMGKTKFCPSDVILRAIEIIEPF